MALPTRVARQGGSEPFDALQREFDSMLGQFFGNAVRGNGNGNGGSYGALAPYGVDVREDADHLYVEAELPGFKKDDVDVTLENQTLTISAQRNEEQKAPQDQGEWLLRERRYNRFLRSFTLPQTVSDQKCDAKLADGVLRITLNKKEETKPRKIQIG